MGEIRKPFTYRYQTMAGESKLFDQEGDKRKQVLFILCNDRKEATQIYNYLVYREIDDEGKDLSIEKLPVKGF